MTVRRTGKQVLGIHKSAARLTEALGCFLLPESENIDGLDYDGHGTKSMAAWAYDYGKGRVVFTAVGHTIHALWVQQHLELQKRAIRWALKEI